MSFAIPRIKKISSMGAIRNAAGHHYRTLVPGDRFGGVPNADPDRRHLNAIDGPRTALEAVEAVRALLPEKDRSGRKIRKDAVRILEYMVTASPDFAGDWDAYLEKAIDYVKQRHGAQNVVLAAIHRDEKTPHAHVWAVPIDEDGFLCAKTWMGSNKGKTGAQKLRDFWTDFAANVGAHFGLERGRERTRGQPVKRHEPIQQYYSRMLAAEGVRVGEAAVWRDVPVTEKKFRSLASTRNVHLARSSVSNVAEQSNFAFAAEEPLVVLEQELAVEVDGPSVDVDMGLEPTYERGPGPMGLDMAEIAEALGWDFVEPFGTTPEPRHPEPAAAPASSFPPLERAVARGLEKAGFAPAERPGPLPQNDPAAKPSESPKDVGGGRRR
jgi:hypothetical protein